MIYCKPFWTKHVSTEEQGYCKEGYYPSFPGLTPAPPWPLEEPKTVYTQGMPPVGYNGHGTDRAVAIHSATVSETDWPKVQAYNYDTGEFDILPGFVIEGTTPGHGGELAVITAAPGPVYQVHALDVHDALRYGSSGIEAPGYPYLLKMNTSRLQLLGGDAESWRRFEVVESHSLYEVPPDRPIAEYGAKLAVVLSIYQRYQF